MADWCGLQGDLLHLIAKCLDTHFDILHFRSVCPSWRASAPLNLQPRPTLYTPAHWIDKEADQVFLLKRTICLLESPPENNQSTPSFWLAILEEDEAGKKHIRNPMCFHKYMSVQYPMVLDVSNHHVQELSRKYSIKKIYDIDDFPEPAAYLKLNGNCIDDDRYMVFIYEDYIGPLRLFRSGDSESTTFELPGWDHIVDFIQFKGKFYAIDIKGGTVCIEPGLKLSLLPMASPIQTEFMYFVKLCGNLLLIKWIGQSREFCELTELDISLLPEIVFEVYQLDEEMQRWVRLESLGAGIVFLGINCSFSAPAIPGVEGNCIVFNLTRPGHLDENGNTPLVEKTYVCDLSTGMIEDMDHRPELLQLFRPPFP